MARSLIENATLVLADRLVRQQSVLLEDGTVEQIRLARQFDAEVDDRFDLGGDYLTPGFIDLDIHGSGTFLVDEAPAGLAGLAALPPKYGVTGFLPAVSPVPKGKDRGLVSQLAAARISGARILGFHLEGPFLALTGPLTKEAIGTADVERVESLIEACAPHRPIFGVFPDFPGVLDLIPRMVGAGGRVFMTHTAATVEQTVDAIEAGARHATHFYDVFPFPTGTEPGVRQCGAVEAILADPRVTLDFILHGEHVHPVACRMALAAKGVNGVCLITDANVGAGLPPGRTYRFSSYDIALACEGAPPRMGRDGEAADALFAPESGEILVEKTREFQ